VVPVVLLNVPTGSCCFGVFFVEGLDDVYYYCPFGIPEFVGYKEVIQKKMYMGLPENSLPNSIHWSILIFKYQ
jgi:hypothetical protein